MIVLKSSQDLGLVKIMVSGVNITVKNVDTDPEQAGKMNDAIEGLRGVEVLADDFLLCGFGDSVAEAIWDHDQYLTAFLRRCRKLNLTLNPQKGQAPHV